MDNIIHGNTGRKSHIENLLHTTAAARTACTLISFNYRSIMPPITAVRNHNRKLLTSEVLICDMRLESKANVTNLFTRFLKQSSCLKDY